MSLKEELAKLEEEEQLTEVEDRLNGIQESIYGLYRRIGVIVEYIDNQEVATITEEQLKQDEQHFREEGIRKAWELKALELAQKNKDLTKLLKEQENEKEPTIEEQQRARKLEYELNEKLYHMYDTGIEAGVNYTMGRVKKEREESASSNHVKGYDGVKAILEKDDIEAIQKALSIKVPSDLASLISKTQVQSEKEQKIKEHGDQDG